MKRAAWPAVIVLVMGCGAIAAAQSTSGTQRGTAARANAQSQQITLTGCLMPGADQNAAVGTTGTTGSSRSSRANTTGQTFMLSNAMPGSGSASASGNNEPKYTPNSVGNTGTTASVGTTGGANRGPNDRAGDNSTASSASAAGTSSYILQGMDLTNQVGQRVEVMGMLVPEKASRSRSSRRGVAGTSGTTGADATMPRLRVTSVRMLAADCNGADSSSPSRTPSSGTSSPGSSTTTPAGTSGTGTNSPTDRPDTTASPAPPPAGNNTPDTERDNDNHGDTRPSPSPDVPGNNR